jgi:integrase
MPAKSGTRQPKYRIHKRSGQAVVTLVCSHTKRRVDTYLGVYDTPESRAKYYKVIGEWEANGRRLDAPDPQPAKAVGGVAVRHVLDGYSNYIGPLVSPTYAESIDRTLGIAKDHYGDTSAATFGPKKLAEVRVVMIGLGWTRKTINTRTQIIVRAFEWAAGNELVEARLHDQLTKLIPLRSGEVNTPEGGGVRAAPEDYINAAIKHMPTPVAAMVRLQVLTGMRPTEVCLMRAVDITVADAKVWYYEPPAHKTAYMGKVRRIRLGPKCIEIITPFMTGLRPDGYLFDPRQANAEGKAKDAAGKRRADQQPNRTKTARVIGEHYTKDSYRRAVQRACDKAKVPKLSPRQFRKNGLTNLERKHGLEVAAKFADHSEATTTARHYIERDDALLDRVALESA